MRFWGLMAVLLLLAEGAFAGSFNRIPSRPKPEPAPAAEVAAPAPVAAPAETPPAQEVPAKAAAAPEGEGVETEDADEAPRKRFEKACIYGPKGLLYAPPGIACDPVQKPDAPEGLGRCILGRNGEVIHRPAGVECEGRVGAGTTPDRAPTGTTPRARRARPPTGH